MLDEDDDYYFCKWSLVSKAAWSKNLRLSLSKKNTFSRLTLTVKVDLKDYVAACVLASG